MSRRDQDLRDGRRVYKRIAFLAERLGVVITKEWSRFETKDLEQLEEAHKLLAAVTGRLSRFDGGGKGS